MKGTIQWVSARHAVHAEVRLYDHLFTRANPDDNKDGGDFLDYLNPDSLQVIKDAKLEPALAAAKTGDFYQFLRIGYFVPDSVDSRPDRLVFNRTVSLKDSWAKIQQGQQTS